MVGHYLVSEYEIEVKYRFYNSYILCGCNCSEHLPTMI